MEWLEVLKAIKRQVTPAESSNERLMVGVHLLAGKKNFSNLYNPDERQSKLPDVLPQQEMLPNRNWVLN